MSEPFYDYVSPIIPEFPAFVTWLRTLDPARVFKSNDGVWACGCPVSAYLTEMNKKTVVVGIEGFVVDGHFHDLDANYRRLIRHADRCHGNPELTADVAAMLAFIDKDQS